MSEINPNERMECPECKNDALLKKWVFVEETLAGMVFKCPHCKEQMTTDSMRSV